MVFPLLIPFGVGAAIVGGAVWLLSEDEASRERKRRSELSTLEKNFERLRDELEDAKGPRVAILGGPGIGKSTLLKVIGEGKVRPEPKIGAETDATDWSESTDVPLLSYLSRGRGTTRLTLVDFPGFGTSKHPTSVYISNFPLALFDRVIFLIGEKLRADDERIAKHLLQRAFTLKEIMEMQGRLPRITFARTKADALDAIARSEVNADVLKRLGHDPRFLSAKTNEGIDELRHELLAL